MEVAKHLFHTERFECGIDGIALKRSLELREELCQRKVTFRREAPALA